jgi:glycosyltransferase involved in cell wall biosynthesis
MGDDSIRFLYVVSEGFPPTVFDSQVLDYLHMMEGQGIRFDLVVFERLLGIFPNWRRNLWRLREVRAQLNGHVYFRFLITTFLEWDFWVPQQQLYWVARPHDPKIRTVIHARTQTSAAIALRLKSRIPNTKVVFDMRGDTPAEFMLGVEKSGRDSHSTAVRRKYEKLKSIERQAVRGSDAILCVSRVMRDKVIGEYLGASQRIHVIPTVASARKFYWEPQLRRAVRKELGIEDKLTFVFAGSIRAYQSIEVLLDFFRELQGKHPQLHLLLITPQCTEAEQFLDKSLSPGTYTIRSSDHDKMVHWLNAADAGLLLRESNAVNQVAAPTKFAEYVMCGLPVVMTAGIGDFSELARKERLGIVLGENRWQEELNAQWDELALLVAPIQREHIARLGKQMFNNEHFAQSLTSLYLTLFDE